AIAEKWISGAGDGAPPVTPPGDNGVLRVGVFVETPPFAYRHRDGGIIGIDADILAVICERLGYELDLVSMEFDALFDALDAREVDLIASCLTVTDERKGYVSFTVPYYTGGISALVMADGP
ncbi:MAG: transporter substrate-binding domain-containing protein, partial [Planctomycetes bacterium]|nr:transporter substrate-binding domain-containing protein [Planctomycetota bacterium]